MSKIITFFIILAAIVGGLFFFALRSHAPSTRPTDTGESADVEEAINDESRPWVEVISKNVRVQTEDGWQNLETGDEIPNGSTIATDENGMASIHMPDGSSIQLDSGSEIVLQQADFDENSDSLKVKVHLAVGRVWSKIVELATTDSYWEVESSNAVASVRGTAFGMEYADEATEITGSENTVEVEARDPLTGESLGKTPVGAKKILSIKKETLQNLRMRRMALTRVLREAPAETFEKPWVKRAVVADQILNKKIQALEDRGIDRPTIRRTIRRELLERRRQILIDMQKAGIQPRTLRILNAPTTIRLNSTQLNATNNSQLAPAPTSATAGSATGQTAPSGGATVAATSTVQADLVEQNWAEIEKTNTTTESTTGTANLGQYFTNQNNFVNATQ